MTNHDFDNQFIWGEGLNGNAQFSSLMKHIPVAIYRCLGDEWLTLEFFNNQIAPITGYPLEYFRGNRKDGYERIVHPDDVKMLLEKMHTAIHNKEKFELEYRIIRKDGELRWVFEHAQGVYDEGTGLGYIDGVIFDITHYRYTQVALEKSENEVRLLSKGEKLSQQQQVELLQRLTLATDSAAIGIWEIDLVSNKVIWDKRMFAIYGYPNGSDKSPYKLFNEAMHPGDVGMMNGLIADIIEGKVEMNSANYRIVLPNGNTRYIESHAIIKKAETGQALSLIGTNRDVTDAILVQEKIKAQNEILREIAFIQSHEVRKPLANILGMIDILKSNERTNKHEVLQHLEVSACELDNKIRDIVCKTNALMQEATSEVNKRSQ